MITFKDLKFVTTLRQNAKIKRAENFYDNHYGTSVIEYKYDEGIRYDVGILTRKNGEIVMGTMFDGPIIEKLTKEQVTKKLKEVQEYLNHGTNRKIQDGSERKIEQSSDENTAYSF